MNESSEPTYWIVHRESRVRAALARIAGAGDNTVLGSPSDDLFASASRPDIVLLAASSDFELELQFAHRFAARSADAQWIVLAEARELAEARRLFDTLPAHFIAFPPLPDTLRRGIARALGARPASSLSRRAAREGLAARFKRWFIDLDQPDLLRALDPRLEHLPLLIRGEVGTGRGVVARYVQAFGSEDAGELIHVPCRGLQREADILHLLHASSREDTAEDGAWRRTIWLEDVDRLPTALQLRMRDWIEFGAPAGAIRAPRLRFIATASDPFGAGDASEGASPVLAPALATALSGLVIELPPLRERPHCIEAFVKDAASAWAQTRGERPREFSARALRELRDYPWPGNMAQLEAAVFRTLSHTSANPLEPHHLKIQHETTSIPDDALPLAEVVDESESASEIPALDPLEGDGASGEVHGEEDRGGENRGGEDRGGENGGHEEPQLETALVSEPIIPPPGEEEREAPAPPRPERENESEPPAAPEPATPRAFETPSPSFVRQSDPAHVGTRAPGEETYRRLVGAVAHEVRNPLTSIRTFSELLPQHHGDEDFRSRFAELVGADVRQIEAVVDRLERLAAVRASQREVVDLPTLLDRVLERLTATIQDRHLLVLKELERKGNEVYGDPEAFEAAFTGVFETAFSMVPERGDLYIASRYNAMGPGDRASVRVLLRYHNPNAGRPLSDILSDAPPEPDGLSPAQTSLEYLISESIIRAQGGNLTIDTTAAQETVIVIDLPSAEDAAR